MKSSWFIFSFAIFLSLSLVIFPGKVFAQVKGNPWAFGALLSKINAFCNPTVAIFEAVATDQPQQSIVRFAYNYDTTRYLKLFYNVFGMSIDNVLRCVPALGFVSNLACGVFTGTPINVDVCNNAFGGARITGITGTEGGGFASTPVSGSLLGLYLHLDAAKTYADPPANLAYFFNQEFKEVPFVGTALAAQADPASFKGFYIKEVYAAWKFVRNMSFGVLALIMLFVGFMMINRTKINPQTVVSIQYALPKIILSVVLIAFSYPIAATLTNLFFLLSVNAPFIVTTSIARDVTFDPSTFLNVTGNNLNFGAVLLYLLTTLLFIGSIGAVLMIVWLICVVIIIIQLLIITVKWLMTYAKMIVEIVLSPVELVLAALPGSEDKSGDSKIIRWFKKIVAYGLSLIVLSAMPVLVLWVAVMVLVGGVIGGLNTTVSGSATQIAVPALTGASMDITFFFIICVIGLSMTSKLPGQIQFMLMGKGPESRK